MDKKSDSFLKTMIIIAGVAVVCLISFLVSSQANNSEGNTNDNSSSSSSIIEKAQSESAAVNDSEMKDFSQIDVDRYLDMYTGKKNKVVLVARPTCSYCQIAEPIIKNIAYKYDIEVNYLNTDDFADDDESRFIQSDELFSEGYGTPMLLLISNNEIVDKVDGLADMDGYLDFFKRNNIISE